MSAIVLRLKSHFVLLVLPEVYHLCVLFLLALLKHSRALKVRDSRFLGACVHRIRTVFILSLLAFLDSIGRTFRFLEHQLWSQILKLVVHSLSV